VNVNNFVAQAGQGATINEAEGWVQNPNQALAQQAIANYQAQVTNYVNAQNPNATLGDVSGTRAINPGEPAILLGHTSLYTDRDRSEFQVIPDNLRWKFRYSMYANDTDRADANPFHRLHAEHGKPRGKGRSHSRSAQRRKQTRIRSQLHTAVGPAADFVSRLPDSSSPELRVEGHLWPPGLPSRWVGAHPRRRPISTRLRVSWSPRGQSANRRTIHRHCA